MPDNPYDWNDPTAGQPVPPGPSPSWRKVIGAGIAGMGTPPPPGQAQGQGQNQGQHPPAWAPGASALAGGLSAGFANWLAQKQSQKMAGVGPGQLPAPPQIQQPLPAPPAVQVPGRYRPLPVNLTDPTQSDYGVQ